MAKEASRDIAFTLALYKQLAGSKRIRIIRTSLQACTCFLALQLVTHTYIYIYIYIYIYGRKTVFEICLHMLRGTTRRGSNNNDSFTQNGGLFGECHVFVMHCNVMRTLAGYRPKAIQILGLRLRYRIIMILNWLNCQTYVFICLNAFKT